MSAAKIDPADKGGGGGDVIFDHADETCAFSCLRRLCCVRWKNVRVERQRLVMETTRCYYCCWKTELTQIDMDQVDDIQLRRHMCMWCWCVRCCDPGTIRMWGKDEDAGVDPSYVDLGLFPDSEAVFESWSNVLCTGGDNELRAIHESSK